jgi:hypothetical protein
MRSFISARASSNAPKNGKVKAIAIVEITDDNGLLYSAAQAMRCTQLELAGAIGHLQSKFITTNGEFE